MSEYKQDIAYFILRVFAGILFFFQGYDKIFKVKIKGVVNTFLPEAEHKHVQRPIVIFTSYLTSYIEFIAGALLILGFFTHIVLYALGIDLILVCIAFSFLRPMWDMQHVFPRLLLVSSLLLLPDSIARLSIDYLLHLTY